MSACVHTLFCSLTQLVFGCRDITTRLIAVYANECATFLQAAIDMEVTPYTQNTHYLQDATEKWMAKYKAQRAGRASLERPVKRARTQALPPAPSARTPSRQFSHPEYLKGLIFILAASEESPDAVGGFHSFTNVGFPVSSPRPVAHAFSPYINLQTLATPQQITEDEKIDQAVALLNSRFPGLKAADLAKLLPGDIYETEIALMSGVRAYFQVREFAGLSFPVCWLKVTFTGL